MVTSLNNGMRKDIKFFCNIFIWVFTDNLILDFYKATMKKCSSIAILSFGSLQHCFQQFVELWGLVGRKERQLKDL